MITKILIAGKEFGIDAYENNFDGEVQINDTFHCKAKVDGFDTIFGTNDSMITVTIPSEELEELAEHILKEVLVESVVDTLHSRDSDSTYERSLAFDCTQDALSDIKYDIADMADEIMTEKYDPQCKHGCADCAGYETTGECNHGCHDCSHFDGESCFNVESNYYGRAGGIPAADCHIWSNGE